MATNVLTPLITNIIPGTRAFSTTLDDVEYLCFSNLSYGTDIPRQYNPQPSLPDPGKTFTLDRVSQVGPGSAPTFQVTSSSTSAPVTITSWASSGGNTVIFQAVNSFTAGEVVRLNGFLVSTFFNSKVFSVLGTGLSGTQFEISFSGFSGGSDTGTATPQFGYNITSISQPAATLFNGQIALWSAGPGLTSAGTTITLYYGSTTSPPDTALVNQFNSGRPTYVYITGSPFGNGVQQVTGIGKANPPGESPGVHYFTISAANSQYQKWGGPSGGGNLGSFNVTLATLNVSPTTPIPNLSSGDQIVVTGATPSGWNNTWTITNALRSGVYLITQTQMVAGVGKYTYEWSGTGPAIIPQVGQLVTVIQTLNGNGIFNIVDGVISSLDGGATAQSGVFNVTGFNVDSVTATAESGQAQTAGTAFQFDPGQIDLGSLTNPIFGNDGGTGIVTVIGSNTAITAGTRQAVVFFETRNGFKTAVSAPVTFTTAVASNYIVATNIPVGPPNVIRRWLAFTGAGPNGIPGPYFYTIDTPVTVTINNQNYLYSATYIDDNVTTSAKFTFTDAVLLAGEEIDVQGNNLFNQIELGSCAWNCSYASRMFYGLEQNKVLNFNNLSFDGGYIPNSAGIVIPAGWGLDPGTNTGSGVAAMITGYSVQVAVPISPFLTAIVFTANNNFVPGQQVTIDNLSTAPANALNGQTVTVSSIFLSSTRFAVGYSATVQAFVADTGSATPVVFGATLIDSPVFGDAYYIANQQGSLQSALGMIVQGAYTDTYNVPIIQPNTLYSVRVAASIPSGTKAGSLVIDLTEFDTGLVSGSQTVNAYGATYGLFEIPFSDMSTGMQIFTGTLLTVPFTQGVPAGLLLRVWAKNIGATADVLIDRLEVFPTEKPVLTTNIRVSYPDNFEAFDGVTGNLGLSAHDTQPCFGAVELHDQLYFLQQSSMQSTQDVPGVEPSAPGGGWALHEVSNRVGACGIYAYDYGEEWILTACRNGLFGFNGGQPIRIDFQQREIWDLINWNAGNTIIVRNDIPHSRILVAVPLPTPNRWLPRAPVNAAPTSPNVILMWNYQNLNDFDELVSGRGVHTTMFGTLAAVDMRLKMSLWQIKTPYMGFIRQSDGLTDALTICNGVGNNKIYQLDEEALSDDGIAVNGFYCTYGFVNSAKASQNPLLGFHRKNYQLLQQNIYGSGTATVTLYPNMLLNLETLEFNPVAVEIPRGIPLVTMPTDDTIRPVNIAGNRVFISYETNAVGSGFKLDKCILVGNIHQFSSVNPNAG